jgi:Calcineurin-like phosphoesterase
VLLAALAGASCASEEPAAPPSGAPAPTPLPPLASAPPLTTDVSFTVVAAVAAEPLLNPADPADMERMLSEGYGDHEAAPGQPVVTATLDGAVPPARGANPERLTRFVHLADTQLADDESPARMASFDSPGQLAGAFRPQEGHECRILNAAVRTINAYHGANPIEFVLLGGDNIDNAQSNELSWFMKVLDGADRVECDSGHDDDPVPGPDNDPKDAFVAEGLRMPWRWVMGNHDILHQGTFPIAGSQQVVVGNDSQGGTRDWTRPGAPVRWGEVVADPARAQLPRTALLDEVAGALDGHGIGPSVQRYGKAFYWFDIEGTPLRVIVLDTAAETGSATGVLRTSDVEGFIRPALDTAKRDGKWVVLTSHHASTRLGDGSLSSAGIEPQPDALSVSTWTSLVGSYDNVLLHLAGHSHVHRAARVEPEGGRPYWELQTSALSDYPNQVRVIEVWDEDNGFLTIRGIALDYVTDGDPIAEEGRRRGIVDLTSGYGRDGRGEPSDRNVELWIRKPR